MTLTFSKPMDLGATAPDFSLPDVVTGKELTLTQLRSPHATVVMFICNHCPYVRHIIDKLAQLAQTYQAKGVAFIAISSNDVEEYPQDSPDKMKQFAAAAGFTFPYLYDESQQVAKSYGAACTPEFYVFDGKLGCVYDGRFDSSSPGKSMPVTGEDLSNALDAVLQGKPVTQPQYPSMGCNIKWKSEVI